MSVLVVGSISLSSVIVVGALLIARSVRPADHERGRVVERSRRARDVQRDLGCALISGALIGAVIMYVQLHDQRVRTEDQRVFEERAALRQRATGIQDQVRPGADFRDLDMSGVGWNTLGVTMRFRYVDLTGSNFESAGLDDWIFTGSDLTDVSLANTSLARTNFTEVLGLDTVDFSLSCWFTAEESERVGNNFTTIFPPGFVPTERRPNCVELLPR